MEIGKEGKGKTGTKLRIKWPNLFGLLHRVSLINLVPEALSGFFFFRGFLGGFCFL